MHDAGSKTGHDFAGFAPLSANFVYAPNQFFDVCLPYYSRNVVRLVAYLLWQTLGFRDSNGDPIRQDVSVTFNELIQKAGISRGSLKTAIVGALDGNFIVQNQFGRPKQKNSKAKSSSFSLQWGSGESYIQSPVDFDGFYTGPGCRTPIPTSFFDHVIPHETLNVTKVVGTILRFTVGYENQFGNRRSEAELSYNRIQSFARIKSRADASSAIRHAYESRYIVRVREGQFHQDGSKQQVAVYAPCWAETEKSNFGSKNVPAEQFKKRTRNGSESEPVERFKNRTSKESKTSKQSNKQSDVVAEMVHRLAEEGIEQSIAEQLVSNHPRELILNQLRWLADRPAARNPAGMLRKAIEENWRPPVELHDATARKNDEQKFDSIIQQKQESELAQNDRITRRQRRLKTWGELDTKTRQEILEAALKNATNELVKRSIAATDLAHPSVAVLDQMDLFLGHKIS